MTEFVKALTNVKIDGDGEIVLWLILLAVLTTAAMMTVSLVWRR